MKKLLVLSTLIISQFSFADTASETTEELVKDLFCDSYQKEPNSLYPNDASKCFDNVEIQKNSAGDYDITVKNCLLNQEDNYTYYMENNDPYEGWQELDMRTSCN